MPVRAIRQYITKSQTVRGSHKLLFISHSPNYIKEISPVTVSGWLKQVIQAAYFDTNKADKPKKGQIKAHQVRSTAATRAYTRGCSMRQLMEACFWKSQTTCTMFYLKDYWSTSSQEERFSLGPFIAAGSQVDQFPGEG